MQIAQRVDVEQIRKRAEEIYCNMRFIRLSVVASRAGCSREQVEQWRDEYRWMEIRAQRFKAEKDKVAEQVGTKRAHAIEQLRTAQAMRVILQKQLEYLNGLEAHRISVSDLTALAEAIRKMDQLIDKQFSFLEVR
jgi:hypothetical protein